MHGDASEGADEQDGGAPGMDIQGGGQSAGVPRIANGCMRQSVSDVSARTRLRTAPGTGCHRETRRNVTCHERTSPRHC
jgi:hypothetical protein